MKSIEAEQAVLGSIMIKAELYHEVRQIIEAGDFSSHPHQVIFELMGDLIGKGEGPDPITLHENLDNQEWYRNLGGIQYLSDMAAGSFSSVNVTAYANLVLDRRKKRNLLAAANKISELSKSPAGDANELISKAQMEVMELSNECTNDSIGGAELGKLCREFLDNDESGIEFGVFQKHTGRMHPAIYVLAAAGKQGKTTMALNITANVMENHHTLFFSYEMPAVQLANRMAANWGNVPHHLIHQKKIIWEADVNSRYLDSYASALVRITKSKLNIYDRAPNFSTLLSTCRSMAARGKCEFIVIDYLQLIPPDKNFSSENEKLTHYTNNLKQLQMELKVPILLLSQLSRGHASRANNRPRKWDLRGSGAIEQDADYILFLYNEKQYRDGVTGEYTELYTDGCRHCEDFAMNFLTKSLGYCRFEGTEVKPPERGGVSLYDDE